MARLSPFITLAAGGIAAGALGVMSATVVSSAPADQDARAAVAAPASPSPEQEKAAEKAEQTEAPDPTPVRADFAGRVKGNNALLALSIRKGKAIAYFCDGKIEAWFAGTAKDGEATLTGFGKSKITARVSAGKAVGEVDLGKKEWDFSAPAVKKPSGLYRASQIVRGARIRAGWIVLPDGTQVGVAVSGDRQIPAPPLEPGTDPVIDGVRVDAKDVDEFIGEM